MNNQDKPLFIQVLKIAALGFVSMSPMLLGVIRLVGIMQIYVTPDMMEATFGKGMFIDTLIGTFVGAISSGNPAISYVIGGEFLEEGVSLYAVTAFILSWVTLGIIQLPAEITALGFRFTLYRNLLSLITTILIAMAIVKTVGMLK